MGYSTNQSSSLGDLPDNVIETVKAMVSAGAIDPREATYDGLPDLGEGFTEALQGGEHVTHEGLIDMAHQDGLCMTYTEPVQIPTPEDQKPATRETENGTRRVAGGKPVVFRAVVVTQRGVFTAYGDATGEDTMVDAVIRMAETRALSRALRQAVNVGKATAPEMPESTDGVVVDE